MAYQVEVTRNGAKKVLKDAISLKPHTFDSCGDAQAFADSYLATIRADWKMQGRKLPVVKVI